MFDLLIGLTGLIFGGILSFISPEEFVPGRKYFILMKRVVFVTISLTTIYYLKGQTLLLIISFILLILLFNLDFPFGFKFLQDHVPKNIDKRWLELVNYAFFIMVYFFNSSQDFHLLLSSLIFLYGLPTGTLLWQARNIWKKHSKEK